MKDLLIPLLIVVFGVLSIEVGMAAPILEIIAGVIGANLFQPINTPWMDFVANFGILGLMFFAGLEVDKDRLRRNAVKGVVIGSGSYFIPFLTIFIVSLILLADLRRAALTAVTLSTTSLALVYPVLKDLGMLSRENGQVVFTGAFVVDVLSMLSLTVLFRVFSYLTIIFLAFALIFMYHAPRLGELLFRRYKGNLAEIELKFILFILISLLFFSEAIGIEKAILAFISGFLFSELLEKNEEIVEKLRGMVFGFMSPIFFFKAGSLMNFSDLTAQAIALAAILSLTAFTSKYFSTKIIFSKIISPQEKLGKLAGTIFNFRLTFGIVSALFGLEMGILTKDIYTAVITAIISTSIASSIILKTNMKKRTRGDSNPRPPA